MFRQKLLTQAVLCFSACSFLGSTVFIAINLLSNPGSKSEAIASSTANDQEQRLRTVENGYLSVLNREPNNQTALKGLVDTRLQLKNLDGAIESLKRLVELNPQETFFLEKLAQLYLEKDDQKQAKNTIEKLALLSPQKYEAWLEEVEKDK